MSAKQAFALVIGLITLAFIEGLIKAAWPSFPLIEVLGFQNGIAGGLIVTKLLNDRGEMKYCGPARNGNGGGQ